MLPTLPVDIVALQMQIFADMRLGDIYVSERSQSIPFTANFSSRHLNSIVSGAGYFTWWQRSFFQFIATNDLSVYGVADDNRWRITEFYRKLYLTDYYVNVQTMVDKLKVTAYNSATLGNK